jgi:hypothetical protein
MKITLYEWDVQEVIEEYIAQQLGADTERFDIKEIYFERQTTTYDKETEKWITSKPETYPFDDSCELTVYIEVEAPDE